MDTAGILTVRAEKAALCPHPVFSSTSLQECSGTFGVTTPNVKNRTLTIYRLVEGILLLNNRRLRS